MSASGSEVLQGPSAAGAAPHRRLRPQRGRLLAGVGVALVATLGTAGVAVPIAAANNTATTIKFVAVEKKSFELRGSVEVDVDETAAGKVIGSDSLICRANGPKGAPRCIATVDLAAGGIVALIIPSPKAASGGPILAGTGSYSQASGTVVGTTISATRTDIVVTLQH